MSNIINIPETIKLIQEQKKLLEKLKLQNLDGDLIQCVSTQTNRLIATLPDKMPYPDDNHFFGHKNGDLYSEHTNKMTVSNPEKSGYIRNSIGTN